MYHVWNARHCGRVEFTCIPCRQAGVFVSHRKTITLESIARQLHRYENIAIWQAFILARTMMSYHRENNCFVNDYWGFLYTLYPVVVGSRLPLSLVITTWFPLVHLVCSQHYDVSHETFCKHITAFSSRTSSASYYICWLAQEMWCSEQMIVFVPSDKAIA